MNIGMMRTAGCSLILLWWWNCCQAGEQLGPKEPVEIGTEPQFVCDLEVVDNVWSLKYKREAVERRFHQPVKYAANPVIQGDGGYCSLLKDEQTGRLKMWYQTWFGGKSAEESQYAIAYAESADGIKWELPKLGLHNWRGSKDNNIVFTGAKGRRASAPVMLELPEDHKRGFRYVMLYREDGIRAIGSQDGLHFDMHSDTQLLPLHSDTQNQVVWDERRRQFVMFCRAKHLYRKFDGDVRETGESRRIAVLAHPKLWEPWQGEPQNVLLADEIDTLDDFSAMYGLSVRRYGGMYWALIWPFKFNDNIHTELAWSRDGWNWFRPTQQPTRRPRFLPQGPSDSWDDGMTFGCAQWVEMGDEWWFYYAGWDGPHGIRERQASMGLAKLRKEGFISLHGPPGGGVVVTRQLRWPGGDLLVNAQADQGKLLVRVSDAARNIIPGFDFEDGVPFSGNLVSHPVTWKAASLDSLAGKVIRLEFFLSNADLFTFRSTGRRSP